MEIEWNRLSPSEWDRLLAGTNAPLQQDWAYGEALASFGPTVQRAVIREGKRPLGCAQVTVRRLFGLVTWALCTRGPVWFDAVPPETKALAYRRIRQTVPAAWPRAVFFTPHDPEDAAGLAAAGLRRVMTGYSLVTLDLTRDEADLRTGMHGKWRNRLRAAEKSGLDVRRSSTKPAQYDWLLEREEEQRARKRYGALPVALVNAYQNARGKKQALRIWRADRDGRTVGVMMFLLHGRAATYHIGWLDEAGRRAGAHNLILWTAMRCLKTEGVTTLDLGGVDTEHSPGLARFKLGTGGQTVTLCGTYV